MTAAKQTAATTAKSKTRNKVAATTVAQARAERKPVTRSTTPAVKRVRAVADDRVRTLAVDATRAQEAYLSAALRALSRHGTLRAQTLGKALFSTRTDTAAHGAAKRTLAAAVKRGLVDGRRRIGSQQVFYALTKRGADYLNATAPLPYAAVSGLSLLSGDMRKANHREWASTIATAADKREGLVSFGELEVQREPAAVSKTLLGERFQGQHLPDALTFDTDTDKAVWHEVELSRRTHWSNLTQARKQAAENAKVKRGETARRARSGRDQFVHLLQQLRAARFLTRAGKDFEVVLVAHCASELIRVELGRLVVAAFGTPDTFSAYPAKLETHEEGRHYSVNFLSNRSGSFDIWLQDLPADDPAKASVFDTELLWPDAPQHLREDSLSEAFIAEKKQRLEQLQEQYPQLDPLRRHA